ncbi:MAG TPA: DUF2007 domain-containing protein [Phycisphaeraceae bacterium]
MKQVYVARDALEAHWVKAELEREGIPAVVLGELLARVTPEIPFTQTFPTVHVAQRDELAALRIIEELETRGPRPGGQPWVCPRCGEVIEATFDACWRCADDDDEQTPP